LIHVSLLADPRFFDPLVQPTDAMLAERVGKGVVVVEQALEVSGTKAGKVTRNWRFSKTSGWYLTFDRGAKRLFYLFPRDGDLLLKLVFNERGVEALHAAGLPDAVRTKLAGAKTYAEGTLLEFIGGELTVALLSTMLAIKFDSMR